MKSRSFFFNLFITVFTLICAAIFVIVILFYYINNYNYINNLKNIQLINSEIILKNIQNDLVNYNFEKINNKLNKFSDYYNLQITVIKPDGDIIYDSMMSFSADILNDRDVKDSLKLKKGFLINDSKLKGKKSIYISLPVMDQKKLIAVIRTNSLYAKINILFFDFKELIIILLMMIICSLILTYIIFNFISKPLNQITNSIKKIIDGNFNTRIMVNDYKEVEDFSKYFNLMVFKLNQNINELSNERDEFKSIFESVKEAIIVIDDEDKIIRVNNSFYELMNVNPVINKYYWEIIRESDVINYIKDDNKEKFNVVKEIYFKSKYLLCSINYIALKKYHVIIFYDITKIKNLENIKKDFISNVSHELHTPLTAIKGFVETLMDEEKNRDKIKYLDIINRHSERLINMVKDLLTLSKLEKSNLDEINEKIKIEKINITDIIKTLVEMFEAKLKEKKIKISYKISDGIKIIEGDYFKLEQLFINLIDNAIKYTDKGEIKIIAANDDNKEKIKIEIIDTGIGIPENDLSRIFERFYVIDKSRSKSSGGTGLGLSIVKYIVLLHNGDIKVKSELNQGSVFTVILPKKQILTQN